MNSRGLLIRQASGADAEELLAIYRPYVENTAVTFEYRVPSPEEFRERIRDTLLRYPYLAAVEDGRIVGYAYASPFHARPAYDWAVETSIYVDREQRGRGLGRCLYLVLEEELVRQNIINVNACISFPNPGSVAFHRKMGYREAAHFHSCGYKLGRWYDMIWMEKALGEHPIPPLDIIWRKDLGPAAERRFTVRQAERQPSHRAEDPGKETV